MANSYDDNMKRWLQFYPLESFFLIENNDLSKKPFEILRETETFLGLKHYFSKKIIYQKRIKTGKYHNFMSNTTRHILINYFRPHTLNFFRLVNRTFPWTLYSWWIHEVWRAVYCKNNFHRVETLQPPSPRDQIEDNILLLLKLN